MSQSNKENTAIGASSTPVDSSFSLRNPNRSFFLRSASQIPKNIHSDVSNNSSINPSQKQRVIITQDQSDRSLQVAAKGILSQPSQSTSSALQPQQQQPVAQQIASTGRKRIFEDTGMQGQSHLNNNHAYHNHSQLKDKENIKNKENDRQSSLFFSSVSEGQPKKSVSSLRSPERIPIEPICNNPITEEYQSEADLRNHYQILYEESQSALHTQQEQAKNALAQQANESLKKQQELVIKMQHLQQEQVGLVGQIKQKDVELGQLKKQVEEEFLDKERLNIDAKAKKNLEGKNEYSKQNVEQLEKLVNDNKYLQDIITQGKQYIAKLEEDQHKQAEMYQSTIAIMRSDIDKLIASNQDVASKLEIERKEFQLKDEEKNMRIEELNRKISEQDKRITDMGRERSDGIVYIQKLQREIEELRKRQMNEIQMQQQQQQQISQQQQFQQQFGVSSQQPLLLPPSQQYIYQLQPQHQFTTSGQAYSQPSQYQSQFQQPLQQLHQDLQEEEEQVVWNASAASSGAAAPLSSDEMRLPAIPSNYDNLTQITEEDAEDMSQLGSSSHHQAIFVNPNFYQPNSYHENHSTISQFVMHPHNKNIQLLPQQQQQDHYQILPEYLMNNNTLPRQVNHNHNSHFNIVSNNSQDNASFSSLLSPPSIFAQQSSSVYSPQSFNTTSPAIALLGSDIPSQVRATSVPRQSITLAKSSSVRSLVNNSIDSNSQSDKYSSSSIQKQQQTIQQAAGLPPTRISGYPKVSNNNTNNFSEQRQQQLLSQGQFSSSSQQHQQSQY